MQTKHQLYWSCTGQYAPSGAGPIRENIALLSKHYWTVQFINNLFSNYYWPIRQIYRRIMRNMLHKFHFSLVYSLNIMISIFWMSCFLNGFSSTFLRLSRDHHFPWTFLYGTQCPPDPLPLWASTHTSSFSSKLSPLIFSGSVTEILSSEGRCSFIIVTSAAAMR